MADKHILRIHDTQANLIAQLKDKQIAWATDINEAIWRNGTNFHFLGSGKYWDGTKFVFDNVDVGKISLFDRTAGTILGELDANAGTFTINFAGAPMEVLANSFDLTSAGELLLGDDVVFNVNGGIGYIRSASGQFKTKIIKYSDDIDNTGGQVSVGSDNVNIIVNSAQRLKATGTGVEVSQKLTLSTAPTDNGADYTNQKMLTRDATTGEVEMADVPSGAAQNLESVLTQGKTTGANKITFQDFVNALKTDGDLWKEGGYLNVEGLFRVFGNINLGDSVSNVTGQLVTILKNTDLNGYVEVAGGQGTTTGGAFRMYGNAASASLANKTIFYGGIGLASSFDNTNPQESNIWKQSTDGRHKLIENGQEVFLKTNLGVTSDGSELNNNLDTTRRMDMYRVDTTWTGSPYTAGAFENQGFVFHQDYNANFAIQIHSSLDINFGMKKRTKNSGTWSAWGDVVPSGSGSQIKYWSTTNFANITGEFNPTGIYQATAVIPPCDITAASIEVECTNYSTASTAKVGVYSADGSTQLATGSVSVSATGTYTATLGSSVSMTGGSRYWVAFTDSHGSNSYSSKSFTSAPPTSGQREGTATGSFGTWGLPTSLGTTPTTNSIYMALKV